VHTRILVMTASFQDNLGRVVSECQTILDFNAIRDDATDSDVLVLKIISVLVFILFSSQNFYFI